VSVLEGITPKTTKADLMGRLRDAAKKIAGFEDESAKRMQEIEEKVRASLKPVTLITVMCSSTPEEWKEAVDFLENFEGYLPSSLARIREGAKEASKDAK
jgi:hypothetical protein